MDTVINVGQSKDSVDFGNTTARLDHKKERAASLAGRDVSVHEESRPQPSSQNPVGPEEHSSLANFEIQTHDPQKSSVNSGQDDWVANLEKLHHPSVPLKFEGFIERSVIGCLDFKKLLQVNIDIIGTKQGGGIGFHPGMSLDGSADARVEVVEGKEKTIITFIDDFGCESAKLHIGNEYWEHNSLSSLIDQYKIYKLM
ncbi:hypothetical protein ACTL6P_24080 [Endozoicomonas acroporae]|uniref:hypothetical protein n=1 Tax=Endozoicomonas acroporae TaxID=1701104 RepID=UPI000C77FCA3|nr:hypothetical protein [Endozoicomonas acroporae]